MRWLLCLFVPFAAHAESLVATRMIAPGSLIVAADITLADAEIAGALDTPDSAIGQTARVAIYPGRPVIAADLGPPVLVKRNQTIPIRFAVGSLSITAEGRALGAGAAGETVRVMNLSSKTTLSGLILPDGTIAIGETSCAGC